MSKKKGKFAKQKKKAGKGLWIAVCVLIILLAAVVGMLYMLPEDETEASVSETQQTTTSEQQLTSETRTYLCTGSERFHKSGLWHLRYRRGQLYGYVHGRWL
mgnify:CR=1 FL=1